MLSLQVHITYALGVLIPDTHPFPTDEAYAIAYVLREVRTNEYVEPTTLHTYVEVTQED